MNVIIYTQSESCVNFSRPIEIMTILTQQVVRILKLKRDLVQQAAISGDKPLVVIICVRVNCIKCVVLISILNRKN